MGVNCTIELHGCDGSYLLLSGPGCENSPVVLGTDPQGLYDAPVKVSYRQGAFEVGGKPSKVTYPYRELMLGLAAMGDTPDEWAEADSMLRNALDYTIDPWDPSGTPAKLAITTTRSGTRYLYVLLQESPLMALETDPWDYQHSLLPVKLVAGQPMWEEDDWIGDEEHPAGWQLSSGAAGSGTIWLSNPCDRPMNQTWVLTGNGQATLPDFSWSGPKGRRVPGVDFRTGRDDSDRVLTLPPIDETNGSGARVHLDRMRVPIEDNTGTNLAGLMAGNRFQYNIAPWTPWTELPVSVTGVTGGPFGILCRQPRRWSRPWGLERI